MTPQQYCLRWKHHHSNVQNMFAQLLEKERFCDVTLYCSPSFASQVPNKDTVEPQSIRGVSLRAHRVVLAACSELLGTLLGAHEAHGEPVLVIDGAEPKHLRALLDYMYTGEMNVHHSQLASLLKTAEELRIKGLTDIRWNNKDEPPDSASGAVATTTVPKTKTADIKEPEKKQDKKSPEAKKQSAEAKKPDIRKYEVKKQLEAKLKKSPERLTVNDLQVSEPRTVKEEKIDDKVNVNGGPPPLIKLDLIKSTGTPKRENNSDSETPSPKRKRITSGNEPTEEPDEKNGVNKTEQDRDPQSEQWRHGNMDISASRVDEVAWGGGSVHSGSDEDWADAPADIGSFLDTRLQVIGDNSIDEESNDSSTGQVRSSRPPSAGSIGPNPTPVKQEPNTPATGKRDYNAMPVPKSCHADPRFADVIKLNDYLQHGRRPQFWEEHYVKRVMESVRVKELEMKQAAEILGVSYGTLYGRYRDVYGCINRPYRAVRDFWQVKGPSEVLERLQRGEISLETAASALGVSAANLAAHVADFPAPHHEQVTDFEPIPIEVDPALRQRTLSAGSGGKPSKKNDKEPPELGGTQYVRSLVKIAPKILKCQNPNASDDDEAIPSTIISTDSAAPGASPSAITTTTKSPGGRWPAIRVASIDSLRDGQTPANPAASASQLMKTRPDLTIVAKKQKEGDT